MSAKKLPVEEGIVMLLGDGVSFALIEKFYRYNEEIASLERKIVCGTARLESRKARLAILKKRLLPELQNQIYMRR